MTTLKPEPPKPEEAPSREALELLSKYVHHRPGCEPASVDPACVCVEIAREIDALAAERVREEQERIRGRLATNFCLSNDVLESLKEPQ